MGIVEANVSFDHAGKQVKIGDLINTDHYLYTMFPSRFTAAAASTVTAATTGGTVGTVVKKVEVFNTGGTSLGFVPVYDAIT